MSLEDKVKAFIRPEIQALAAYHVPYSAYTIKLDDTKKKIKKKKSY